MMWVWANHTPEQITDPRSQISDLRCAIAGCINLRSEILLPARFDRGVELCLRFGRNRIRMKRRHELFRGTVLRCRRFQSGRARCIVCQRLGDGISKALIRLIHCCGEQTRDRWCVTQRLSRIVGKTVVYPHLQTVACVSSQHHGVVVTISHRLVRYSSGNGLHLGGRC